MDPHSGELYNLADPVDLAQAERDLAKTNRTLTDLIRMDGPEDEIRQVARAVRSQVERDSAKAKRKAQRASRKRNR